MKLCHITPKTLTRLVPDDYTYHMCIAGPAQESEKYRSYFRDKRARGDFVMLDTCTFEGEQTSIRDLLKLALNIQPSEIILPDVYRDAKETLESTRLACITFQGYPGTFAAVPQGQNLREYMGCVVSLGELTQIATLCIIEEIEELYGVKREYIIDTVAKMYPEKNIHLLGVTDILQELNNKDIQKVVRTCDTSKFMVWNLMGEVIHPNTIPVGYPGRKAFGGRREYFDYGDIIYLHEEEVAWSHTVVDMWDKYLDPDRVM